MKALIKELGTAVIATLSFAIILCCLYPIMVWALAQLLFPQQANGLLISHEGRVTGSRLIGQQFNGAYYFHSRPSSAGTGYEAANSGGSNLGPLSNKLIATVRERIDTYRKENGLSPHAPVPADAVTASASGLDPHISLANARLQAPRVAHARGESLETVLHKIEEHTEGRDLGVLGEPAVNVLMLNMSLRHLQ